MANPQVRGVKGTDDRGTSYKRDTRRLTEQFRDGLGDPLNTGMALAVLALTQIVVPAVAHVAIPLALGILWVHASHRRHRHLPIRLPLSASDTIDINSPMPGRQRYHKGRGLILVGNAYEFGNQEVWLSRDDVCTHVLMIATTGSGKTIALGGEAANYLAIGGGLIFSDAKASPSAAFELTSITRRVGREDDLLIQNYMTGNSSVSATGSPDRLTNTANPLASGSADSLVQIMSSLIPSPEGDNAVFGERALTMMTAVLYGLVDLRDGGHIDLGVSTLRDYLPVERLEQLAFDERLRTETARNALLAYLRSLPNWRPPQDRIAMDPRRNVPLRNADGSLQYEPIHEEAGRQHGFAQMYFTRSLSSLTDTYGHIFFGVQGEVDYGDVVRNRRVLIIMLPAVEKSLSELQNLGKINLSSIRDAVSTGLGSKIEGTRREVVDVLSAGSSVPNKIILDEAGYQSSPGFAVLAAQARSLMGGFSITWASQTWAALKRGSESEADEIRGNTNLKYFGRLNDPDSFQLLDTLAGEARLTQTQGYAIKPESITGGYADTLQAGVEKLKRTDFVDLQAQTEGEFHLVFGGQIYRIRGFYHAVSSAPELRINRYLRIGEKLAFAPQQGVAETAPTSSSSGGGASGHGHGVVKSSNNELPPSTLPVSPLAGPPVVPTALPPPRSTAPDVTAFFEDLHRPALDAPRPTQPPAAPGATPTQNRPGADSAIASTNEQGAAPKRARNKAFFDNLASPDMHEEPDHAPDFALAPQQPQHDAPGVADFAESLKTFFGVEIAEVAQTVDDELSFPDLEAPDAADVLATEDARELTEHVIDAVVSAYPSPTVIATTQAARPVDLLRAATRDLLQRSGGSVD